MRVGALSWDVAAARIAGGALGILPIGAGAKEHGFHLPMDADQRQAEWLADRLASTRDVLIWPTLTSGYYPAFTAYAGSTSLSARVFEDVVSETAASLLGFGLRGLVLVNTGISTITPIDRALARQSRPAACLHLKIYDGPRFRAASHEIVARHIGHADEIETSIVLAIAPGIVAMDRARSAPALHLQPGPLQHHEPSGANYSPTGAIGDPTGATPAKGNALLAAMIADIDEQIDKWLPTLAPPA